MKPGATTSPRALIVSRAAGVLVPAATPAPGPETPHGAPPPTIPYDGVVAHQLRGRRVHRAPEEEGPEGLRN